MPSPSLPGATLAAGGQGVTPQPVTPPCLTRGGPSFHPIPTVLPLLTPGVSHKPTREALDYSTVRANATRSTIRRRWEDKLISNHWVRTVLQAYIQSLGKNRGSVRCFWQWSTEALREFIKLLTYSSSLFSFPIFLNAAFCLRWIRRSQQKWRKIRGVGLVMMISSKTNKLITTMLKS